MIFKQLISLKQKQFTGKVNLQSSQNINWKFYFYLGRLVWVDGGIHPNRSWQRILDKYCRNLSINNISEKDLLNFKAQGYFIFNILVKYQLIQKDKSPEIIKARAIEYLL